MNARIWKVLPIAISYFMGTALHFVVCETAKTSVLYLTPNFIGIYVYINIG